ncbi:MAG: PAS domain S-box protein [Synechococcales bacterium]|nr:PAS domain S-box protein [Synechococcales bacterium]
MSIPAPMLPSGNFSSAIIRNPLVVTPNTPVVEAIALMAEGRSPAAAQESIECPQGQQGSARSGCLVVVEDAQVVGLLTERDVVRLSAHQQPLDRLVIRQVMAHPVVTRREAACDSLLATLQFLQQHQVHHLPLLNEQDCLVGLITCETLQAAIALQSVAVEQPAPAAPVEQPSIDFATGAGEERLAMPLGNLPGYVYRARNDPNYTPEFISSGVTAITGYHPDEYLVERSISCGQEIHPDDAPGVWEIIQKAVGDRQPYECEYRLFTKMGEEKWAWERGQGIYSEAGDLLFLEGFVTEITDRKQAEIALRKTEAQFRKAQQIAHLGTWELDLQHKTLFWSDEIYRIFEIDPQQFAGSYELFLNIVHPDDRDRVDAAYQQHLRDRTPYNLVHRLLLPDGRIKYVQEQCETLYAEDGTPLLSLGTVQDITSLKQAERQREQAEEALRQVTAGTATTMGGDFFPALVSHIAEALGVRYVSVSQATPDGFKVMAFFADGTLNPPGFLPYCSVPCCVQALEMGECCHPDGIPQLYPENELFTRLQVESYLGIGLRNAAGEPSGNLCVLHDRPLPNPEWARTLLRIFAARAGAELERYQTAQALEELTAALEQRVQERTAQLQEREAQLEDLFENANDLIQSVCLANGRFEYVNRAWRETLGYSEAEVPHLTLLEVLHPAYHEHCQNLIRQMQGGTVCKLDRMELIFFTKDRREIQLEGSLNCRLEGDRPVATRAIFRDITERKAAERQLQEREARYRAVMDHASDAIILANAAGRLIEGNRKAEELLGYSRVELTHLHVSQIHPPDVMEAVREHFSGIVLNNQGPSFETFVLRKDGSRIPVDITGSRLELNGEPIAQGIFRDIRDRKRAENALRESQQFLQTVLDTFPLSVFWKDRNSVYLGANRNFLEEAGLAAVTDLIGKTDYDMPWGETDADAYRADDQEVITSNTAKLGIIEPLRQTSGQQIWLETNKLPLHNVMGEVIGVLGTFQDISDRKQAEQTICQQAEREALLREITQRIRQSLDLHTIFDTACREIRQIIHADRVAIFQFYPETNYTTGEFVAESVEDGLSSVVAIRIDDHCFGENYAHLYVQGHHYAIDDIYCYDLGNCYLDILAQFQVRANLVIPLFCGEQLWGLMCVHQCRNPRQWQQAEIDLGQQLTTQLAIALQQANLVQQLQQELTERQQAQRQLTERNQELALSNQELIRATRLKDEFLANMSHELRTPLNAILGMTEGLQEEVFGSINEQQRKSLITVERSASHLLSLINDILDVAKIESGQMDLECTSVAVVPLCSSSLAFIKQQALKKSIQVATSFPPHLPNFWVDERRIRQVLINLLTNAGKFTPEGGRITLTVSFLPESASPESASPESASNPSEVVAQPPLLRVAITDTGIGIASENISKLFRPFVQIDSALNRQYSGTGLGLALVKQIVELHGGQVGVTSELAAGSCFTVDLPCDPATLPGAEQMAAIASWDTTSSASAGAVDPSASPLILLVEDNEANIITISSYLEVKGYRVLLANNGQEAIDVAQAQHPDLILMDIQMPGMDGLEAIRHIRQDPALTPTPIIALTALAMTGDRERCLAAGANEYLAKPVRLKQLVILIQSLLRAERN